MGPFPLLPFAPAVVELPELIDVPAVGAKIMDLALLIIIWIS